MSVRAANRGPDHRARPPGFLTNGLESPSSANNVTVPFPVRESTAALRPLRDPAADNDQP
ncbi:hypothetical protein [Hoyosella subflava]|uniref:Uncharacterized protein n=1 Tax=Hoyosella subflava (strain DSM 45089 / JCM 17490 / NBRC 109087 / DQS3-9A1) TaxID=443218 RepID=F6ESN2_HOYSD|nr:hypothetical protein [Hoyosella subflava]AEF43153.1 hypothetical protein AS9A_P20109 [Hoyosella subflava DQS3-9A1]